MDKTKQIELADDEVIRAAMRLLGKRTSERKRESSRRNAQRPRSKRSKRLARTKHTVSPSDNGVDATVKKN